MLLSQDANSDHDEKRSNEQVITDIGTGEQLLENMAWAQYSYGISGPHSESACG